MCVCVIDDIEADSIEAVMTDISQPTSSNSLSRSVASTDTQSSGCDSSSSSKMIWSVTINSNSRSSFSGTSASNSTAGVYQWSSRLANCSSVSNGNSDDKGSDIVWGRRSPGEHCMLADKTSTAIVSGDIKKRKQSDAGDVDVDEEGGAKSASKRRRCTSENSPGTLSAALESDKKNFDEKAVDEWTGEFSVALT